MDSMYITQQLEQSFSLLKRVQPGEGLLIVTMLIIVLLEVFDPGDRVAALIEHTIYMLKWIEPKPHPPLILDLLALRHPGDCLPVLMKHMIVLLESIEPKPNPSLLARMTKSMRPDCSINRDTIQEPLLPEIVSPELHRMLFSIELKENVNDDIALRELQATIYSLMELWRAKSNGYPLEVAQQGVVRPLAASQGAPGAKTTPELRDPDPSQAAAKDDCNEALPLTRNELGLPRMTVVESIKRDPSAKDDDIVAAVGPGLCEEDVGSAAVPLDVDGERADKSVTRINLPSPANASSPLRDTAEKLQIRTSYMLPMIRLNPLSSFIFFILKCAMLRS